MRTNLAGKPRLLLAWNDGKLKKVTPFLKSAHINYSSHFYSLQFRQSTTTVLTVLVTADTTVLTMDTLLHNALHMCEGVCVCVMCLCMHV